MTTPKATKGAKPRALKTYGVWASVVGTKYLGEFQAESKEAAEEMAMESDAACVSLCHQCTSECEDPAVDNVTAEVREVTPKPKPRRKG